MCLNCNLISAAAPTQIGRLFKRTESVSCRGPLMETLTSGEAVPDVLLVLCSREAPLDMNTLVFPRNKAQFNDVENREGTWQGKEGGACDSGHTPLFFRNSRIYQ